VRSKLVVAWSIGFAVLGGCRFDRSPLSNGSRTNGVARDAGVVSEPDSGTPADAATQDADAPQADAAVVADAAAPRSDASVVSDASVTEDASSSDDASTNMPPVGPPMNGGLECGGTFCAFGLDPEKPCCTKPDDVVAHAARVAGKCGLDLSGLPGAPYGTHCWQRDQLGIIDDRCPNRAAGGGGTAEPGCCADDGTCGTLNADHKLGCRHEPGKEPRACEKPMGSGETCDPIGVFGMRISVDAAWGGRSGGLWDLTDDGRGAIEVYVMQKIEGVDPNTRRIQSTGRVCGVKLPPFYSTTLCELYQPNFPIEIWESPKLPGLTLTGRYDCAANGCVISIDPQTYLLGFSLRNPEAPWPAPGTLEELTCPQGRGMSCYPDHDSDGRPGVTVTLTTSGMANEMCRQGRYLYRAAPLSGSVAAIFNGVKRTDRMQLGIRTKLGGSSRFMNNCDRGAGSALAEYVNSRAAGCVVQPGTVAWPDTRPAGQNEACDSTEVDFIDENLPEYQLLAAGQTPNSSLELKDAKPSKGPEVSIVRLGTLTDDIGCAAVRDAKY
jgi:hypothetical protein